MAAAATGGSGALEVRQATLADKELLFAFIREAYEGRWQYKIPERWQWQFVDNPFGDPTELPIWIAVDNATGAIVGQSCSQIEPLELGGRTTRVSWGVDFFVLPAYRSHGAGTRLQQAKREASGIVMALSLTEGARRIRATVGAQELAAVSTFTLWLRTGPRERLRSVLRRRVQRKGATCPQLADSGISVLGTIEYEPVASFGEEADELWRRLRSCFYAAVPRTSDFLNWKYVRQPHIGYTRLLARRAGDVVAYLIVRASRPPERDVGIIADFLTDPDDEPLVGQLLAAAVQHFRRLGVPSVRAATSVPSFRRQLIGLGFVEGPPARPVLSARYEVKADGWLLGKSDHDWDQYPNA